MTTHEKEMLNHLCPGPILGNVADGMLESLSGQADVFLEMAILVVFSMVCLGARLWAFVGGSPGVVRPLPNSGSTLIEFAIDTASSRC